MALFTIPSLSKGTAGTITLDKAELLALAPIAADDYFSDGANIQFVAVEWNSNPGSQREIAKFKFSDASPSHEFLVSAQAQDVFEVEQLILIDFDNGEMRLTRSDLDAAIAGGVSQFDIDFSAGGGGGGGGASFSGAATSLSFYGSDADPYLPPGATPSVNTLSWSVADGIMTFSYDLLYEGPITGGSAGAGTYGVRLPAGYVFAPAATLGSSLGTATFGNVNNDYASQPRVGASNSIAINLNAFGGWSSSVGGFVFGGRLRLTISAAIPVVADT